MITEKTPNDWRELQNLVGQILYECGMAVEIEKIVKLARGQVEIDVVASETIKGRSYQIFSECKYWRSAVPQNVVHGFRTAVQDGGAHKGYIISTAGFQTGAHTAAELTNVELVTWPQFQNEFETTWIENYFVKVLTEVLDPLMTFTEPLAPFWFPNLSEPDRREFMDLFQRYMGFGHFIMSCSSYTRVFGEEKLPRLPLRGTTEGARLGAVPDAILDAAGYRGLMLLCLDYGNNAIAEFRAIRDRNGFSGGE